MSSTGHVSLLERASWIVVWASAFTAASWELEMASRDWPPCLIIGIVVFTIATCAGARFGRRSTVMVFACGYLFPVVSLAAAGHFRNPFFAVWLLPLLGAMIATMRDGHWSFPGRWRAPLVLWAVIVALSWPLIVFRENDFYLRLFDQIIPISGIGNTPAFASTWIMNVALTHLTGLLWMDWLIRHYGSRRNDFAREVAVPLAIVALAAAVLSVYQGLVDVTWMAGGQWPAINRAGGSLVDGNPSGMLMALWSTLFLVFALSPDRRLKAMGIIGIALAWVAAWASGSRTAIFVALFGLGYFGVATATVWRRRLKLWQLTAASFAAIAVIAAGALAVRTESAMSRLRSTLPAPSAASIGNFVHYQLWDRNGPYGTAAVEMIKDSPLAGVGVGSFHTLLPDYSYPLNKYYVRSDPDNSQNWFRHQLAELGVLGSVGWLVWTGLLLQLLWKARPPEESRVAATAVKAALLALGFISLVAMPTQNTVLALLFWTVVFWWLRLAAPEQIDGVLAARPMTRGECWGIATVTTAFLIATILVGEGQFSLPMRAVKFDWPLTYGFYGIEKDADGSFRWAQAHAVDVMPAVTHRLKVTVWVNHQDIARKPVDVKVWGDGALLLKARLISTEPLTTTMEVPRGDKRVALQTWTSRVERPSDYGSADDRELGLMVRCDFLEDRSSP